MLWALFDESGQHNAAGELTRLTIGGAMAPYERWFDLMDEWKTALDSEGIRGFHMTDFEAYRGEFSRERGWTRERHNAFLELLLGIIDRTAVSYVGATIAVENNKIRPAYRECFLHCLGNTTALVRELMEDKQVALMFAKHNAISGDLLWQVADSLSEAIPEVCSCSTVSPVEVNALQAADLVVFELRKWPGRTTDPKSWRYPMRRLWGDGVPGRFLLYP